MKKLLALTLASLMLFALAAACTSESPSPSPSPSPTVSPSPSPAVSPEASPDSTPDTTDDLGPDPDLLAAFETDRVIGVNTREEGSGTRDAFVSITGVGDDMYGEADIFTSTGEVRSNVAENVFGIGYVSLGSLNDSVKALAIDGVVPSEETIKDGSYTIQRPFLIVTNEEKGGNPLVQDFVKFALSAQGQEHSADGWISPGDTGEYTSPGGLSGTLKIGGSTSVNPLMEELAAAYKALNPDVNIEVSGGGSGTGISEATEGIIDIGMSSRELRENEKENLTEYTIAIDGVVVIVNKDNPLRNLDVETVREIFTGEKTTWSEVIE